MISHCLRAQARNSLHGIAKADSDLSANVDSSTVCINKADNLIGLSEAFRNKLAFLKHLFLVKIISEFKCWHLDTYKYKK
jgi:hypothetical protein